VQLIPVVGSYIVGSSGAALGGYVGFDTWSAGAYSKQVRWFQRSERHGPARFWHPTGQPRAQGAYDHDRRHGPWSFYDDAGRLTEQGQFKDGVREGRWVVTNVTSGQTETFEFVAGFSREDFQRITDELALEATSGDSQRQIIAMHRLEALGKSAVPLLIKLLADPSDDVKLMALRRLDALAELTIQTSEPLLESSVESLVPVFEPLADSADPRIAGVAMLFLFRHSPAHREELYERLMASVRQSEDEAWRYRVLSIVYHLARQQRPTTFVELAHAQWNPPANANRLPDSVSPFMRIALRYLDIETDLATAMQSSDVAVRRFAAMLLVQRILQIPLSSQSAAGGVQPGRQISDELRQVLNRARLDPDLEVSRTADSAAALLEPKQK